MKKRIYNQNRCIEIFKSMNKTEQMEFVHEFRQLYQIDDAIGETTFNMALSTLESFFPAYRIDRILDENGDTSDRFYELEDLVLDKSVSDEEFLKEVLL